MIVSVMIATMIFPIVAFAGAWFNTATFDSSNNTVNGQVYVTSDVYDALNGGDIAIKVYGANGVSGWVYVDSATYATYDMANGRYYYNIAASVSTATYGNNVTLKYYDTTAPTTVYSSNTVSITTRGGYVGGGIILPVTEGTISVGTDGKVDGTILANALKDDGKATIVISGDFALLPASALTSGTLITIVSGGTTYQLPLKALKLDELAKSLGVDLAGLTIKVEIKTLTGDAAKAVADEVYNIGGKGLADAVDFKFSAEGNGKSVEIKNFGTYVSRTLTLKETLVDVKKLVGVTYNPTTKKLSFVPATFATVDGKTIATLKRTSNSIYTVISLEAKSFADLAGHWSKAEVEALASKLVVVGTGANKFEPKRDITRAEFAALVVGALGLEATGTTDKFSDVKADAWYAGVIAAAVNAGIIEGYTDGTFKPNAKITREELASLVVRSLKFAGKDVTLTATEVAQALTSFKDASKLTWAKADIAAAVKAGIVYGQKPTLLANKATTTRSEAAAMINRFLLKAEFI